eukprot:1818173-Amphidinium_carterae.1
MDFAKPLSGDKESKDQNKNGGALEVDVRKAFEKARCMIVIKPLKPWHIEMSKVEKLLNSRGSV